MHLAARPTPTAAVCAGRDGASGALRRLGRRRSVMDRQPDRRPVRVGPVDPVPRVRANALAALAAVTESKGRSAVLERGLRDADARVRDDCERWLAI